MASSRLLAEKSKVPVASVQWLSRFRVPTLCPSTIVESQTMEASRPGAGEIGDSMSACPLAFPASAGFAPVKLSSMDRPKLSRFTRSVSVLEGEKPPVTMTSSASCLATRRSTLRLPSLKTMSPEFTPQPLPL